MNEQEKESLITAAKLAANNSKAFKSNFNVGAAIRVEAREQGVASHIVTGVNCEFNGSPALHAEVAALGKLFSSGFRAHDVTAVAVWCPSGSHYPCYPCLQCLCSHLYDDVLILAASPERRKEATLGELTVHAYKGRKR